VPFYGSFSDTVIRLDLHIYIIQFFYLVVMVRVEWDGPEMTERASNRQKNGGWGISNAQRADPKFGGVF